MSANVSTPSPRCSEERAGAKGEPHEARDFASGPPHPVSLHWFFLLASSVVVALAATMSIRESAGVSLPGLSMPLPELCYFRRFSGLDCPGCGLTRSFIAVAQGEIARAWLYNPAGLLLFPLVALQIPYQAAQLLRLRRGWPPWNLGVVGVGVFAAAVLVMFAQWIVKLAGW